MHLSRDQRNVNKMQTPTRVPRRVEPVPKSNGSLICQCLYVYARTGQNPSTVSQGEKNTRAKMLMTNKATPYNTIAAHSYETCSAYL